MLTAPKKYTIVFVLLAATAAYAGPGNTVPAEALDGNMVWMMFKTLFALAFVVGLIVLLMWGFKKISLQGQHGRSRVPVAVAGVTHLGPKKAIYLVDVAGRRLVLGVTDQSINLLAEVEVSETESVDHPVSPAPKGFRQFLESITKSGEAAHE